VKEPVSHIKEQRLKKEHGAAKGLKDKVPRKKSGYHVRWKNEFDKRNLKDIKK